MAEYKHGSMNVTTQERTFAGFVRFATWSAVLCILVLIFMVWANA